MYYVHFHKTELVYRVNRARAHCLYYYNGLTSRNNANTYKRFSYYLINNIICNIYVYSYLTTYLFY